MKIWKLLIVLFIFAISIYAVKVGSDTEDVHIRSPRVGINTDDTETPSAALEIYSDDSGILIPRLSIAQRDLIDSPETGLLIFNTDCNLFNYFDGSSWIPFPNIAGLGVGPVIGNTVVCESAEDVPYSIDAIADAISYNWTLPDGAEIATGTGTESITVDFGTAGGRLCVEVITTCGIEGDCIIITISDATVAGEVTGGSPIMLGENTPIMTLSGHLGDVIRWQRRHDAGVWSDIAFTGLSYFETPSVAGLWDYRAIVQSAGCPEEASDYTTVEVTAATSDSVIFYYSGIPTTWTAPMGVSSATVKCWGASGGATTGGLGAYLEVTVPVTGGVTYDVFVGGQGGCCVDGAGDGGDASYFAQGSTPLVIAAGGGGGRPEYVGGHGSATTIPTLGTRSNSSYSWGSIPTGGNGGGAGSGEWGTGGGGGWFSAGASGSGSSGGAMSCRASNAWRYVGGAGGGYNGGPGADMASGWGTAGGGGGGSYYSGTLITGTTGTNSGNGRVVIIW